MGILNECRRGTVEGCLCRGWSVVNEWAVTWCDHVTSWPRDRPGLTPSPAHGQSCGPWCGHDRGRPGRPRLRREALGPSGMGNTVSCCGSPEASPKLPARATKDRREELQASTDLSDDTTVPYLQHISDREVPDGTALLLSPHPQPPPPPFHPSSSLSSSSLPSLSSFSPLHPHPSHHPHCPPHPFHPPHSHPPSPHPPPPSLPDPPHPCCFPLHTTGVWLEELGFPAAAVEHSKFQRGHDISIPKYQTCRR